MRLGDASYADDLRNMTQQSVGATTTVALARRVNFLLTLVTPVATGSRARLVVAFVDLRIGVTELDGDVPDQLVLEPDRLNTRDGLDDSRLAVSDVTNSAYVDGGLPRDNLRRQGG